MTRIVVAAAQLPAREGGAAGPTTIALLRGLLASGLDVRCVAPLWQPTRAEVPAGLPVEAVPVEIPERGGVWGAVDRWRRPVHELADTHYAERLGSALADADLVHLEQIETAVFGPSDRPTALHMHYRALLDAPLGAPWSRAFRHRLEFAAAERRAIRRMRWLICNSSDVAAAIRRERPGADVTVAPLPLDPADYPGGPPCEQPTAGLIGTASWAPTAGAIARLLDEVWPRVRLAAPEATLLLAGRGTERFRPPDPSVRVLGTVPSAAEFIRRLAVLLYPAPRGSGTKVKVLEALACGVPVVTSPAGAEGIEPNPGLIVTTGPADLAATAADLLNDGQQRRERGAAGRRYIEQRHAPVPAVAPLLALYERMLG